VAALISKATGALPYFVGKPNPLMMRSALRTLNVHSEETVMIGDRMDTDIVAGIEAGLRTVLVLTGSTSRERAERFPYCLPELSNQLPISWMTSPSRTNRSSSGYAAKETRSPAHATSHG